MSADNSEVVHQFIGAWSLVSWIATATDGSVSYPYGEDPIGRIMYQPKGTMAACLMRRERTLFASENRHEASPEEREAAYRDYVSYFGSYSIQDKACTVTHHVEGATFPNWIGTDLVRSFHFRENTLKLSLVRPNGDAHVLTWSRISG